MTKPKPPPAPIPQTRLRRLAGLGMAAGGLPPEFAQALSMLRSQAVPMPAEQLRRVLGREYGTGWERRFAEFSYEPVAAASIGQVHRVRTADGRDLALKIQYPGVARSIRSDVDNVAALLVPRVHRDMSTPRIMAMDFIEAEPLDALREAPQARRDAVGALLERLLFRELFEFRVMQTDPNLANYLYEPKSGRVVLLDFGATRHFESDFVANYARISRAVIDGDRAAVAREAVRIGYAAAGDAPERIDAVVDVCLLACEPLRHRGRYDFGASDLPMRVRDLAFDLAIRRRLLRSPPPETIFLHRKLAGSFLLLARLEARVDARALILPFLPKAP